MRSTVAALAIALIALSGCSDDPQGPTNEEFAQERENLVGNLKKDKRAKKKARAAAMARAPEGKGQDVSFAGMTGDFHYDAKGKRDPFRSFEWEQLRLELTDSSARGPLEQFDVSQLSVVGVVWNDNNARALIQDPSGMSYVVGEGARIGKNEGRVTRIDDNLVVVKETYVDFMGEETTKDILMRIRPIEGG